jgi:nucleoside-diphosphate-sugar epimerase
MQVFLTGANGFIGGAVAAALIAAGHKVRGLVRNKAKASAVAAHDVQAVVGRSTTRRFCKPKPMLLMLLSMRPAAIIAGQLWR